MQASLILLPVSAVTCIETLFELDGTNTMLRYTHLRLVVLIAAGLLLENAEIPNVRGEDSALTSDEFLAQYIPALTSLENFYREFEAEATYRRIERMSDKVVDQSVSAIAFCDLSRNSFQISVESRKDDQDQSGDSKKLRPLKRVRSLSSTGVFEVIQPFESAKYELRRVGEHERNRLEGVMETVWKPVFLAAYYPGVGIREMLNSPKARILDIHRTNADDGSSRVRVHLELDYQTFAVHETTIEFAPDLKWRIVGYQQTVFGEKLKFATDYQRFEWDTEIEYRTDQSGSFPKRFHQRGVKTTTDGEQSSLPSVEIEAEIVRFDRKPIPEEQFRLSTFGLSDDLLQEPDPRSQESMTRRVWLLLASIGMFVVIAFLYTRTAKGSQGTVPK
jgi:hypothetical protein